jgi:hypothetical protein
MSWSANRVEVVSDVVRLWADVERGIALAQDQRPATPPRQHPSGGPPAPAQSRRNLGMGWHRGEPVRELGRVLVGDRDAACRCEHSQNGAPDVCERHVHAGERERLGVGDQVGEPQPQRGGVVEDAVEGGADRVEVEQRLIDVEHDDRSLSHARGPFIPQWR